MSIDNPTVTLLVYHEYPTRQIVEGRNTNIRNRNNPNQAIVIVGSSIEVGIRSAFGICDKIFVSRVTVRFHLPLQLLKVGLSFILNEYLLSTDIFTDSRELDI
jgi:hypothetical protein